MLKRLDAVLTFLPLDPFNVSKHAASSIISSKQINAERIRMKAPKRNELPDESKLSQIANEVLYLSVRHSSSIPFVAGLQKKMMIINNK
jgi:hypothetical protein